MLQTRSFKAIAYASGFFSLVLGFLVIVSWYSLYFMLFLTGTKFHPMPFNTALCFIVVGMAQLASNRNLFKTSHALSIALIGFSILILGQYLLNINLGLDYLFISQSTPFPYARMSANTASGFLCTGLAFWLLRPPYSPNKMLATLILSTILLFMGLLGLFGYISYLSMNYGLTPTNKMPFHGAIGFIAISCGLFATAYLNKDKEVYVPILPILVTCIILLGTFVAWKAIRVNQAEYLHQRVELKAETILILIKNHLQERTTSFKRITDRWITRPNTTENEWRTDVLNYIADQPGYQAIEWVDKSFHVRWVAPDLGNEDIKGLNIYQLGKQHTEMKNALRLKKIQMTHLINLIQGGKGIIYFDPIFKHNEFDGFMVGVIHTDVMLTQLINSKLSKGFGIEIHDGNQLLFGVSDQEKTFYTNWSHSKELPLLGQTWRITVWPTADLYYQSISSWLPSLTLILGIFAAGLSGFLISALQLLKYQASKLYETRQRLADLNGRLNCIIEGSSDLIAALDLSLNFITFNTAYKNEILRVFKVDLVPGMHMSCLLKNMSVENQQKTMSLWDKAFEGKSFIVIETFVDKNFKTLNFEIRYSPILGVDGKIIGASHSATNITERLNIMKEMDESKLALEELVEHLEQQNKELGLLKEMMNLLQSSATIKAAILPIKTYSSKILPKTSGTIYLSNKKNPNVFNKEAQWGKPLSHPLTIEKSECWALLRNRQHQVGQGHESILCHHVSASKKTPPTYACLPLQAQGDLLGLLYIEITKEESVNKRLIYLAQIVSEQIALSLYNIKLRDELKAQSTHDSLTGLYNRRFLEEFIQTEFLKAKRSPMNCSLLVIDIDHFKSINDRHGHLVGDKVLQALSTQLHNQCRESDLVCRWGGEEFVLFLRDSTRANITPRTESIRRSIENLVITVDGINLPPVTISIGVSFYPDDGNNLDDLIAKADEALYEAKRLGRNQVVIFPLK